jgi:hypothetical protein
VLNRKFFAGQGGHGGMGWKQPDPDRSRVVGTFVGTHRPTVFEPTLTAGARRRVTTFGFLEATLALPTV